MAIVDKFDALNSLSARNKFGIRAGGIPGPNACVFQQKVTKQGKKTSKMVYNPPSNPRTVLQQANRSVFADAVSSWQILTDEQKLAYNKNAVGKHMSGYNLFIREYMLNN
jgi:hypothetical protein